MFISMYFKYFVIQFFGIIDTPLFIIIGYQNVFQEEKCKLSKSNYNNLAFVAIHKKALKS